MPKDPKSTLKACATAVMEHDEESQSIQEEDKPTDLTLVSYHFVLVPSINTVFQYIQFTQCTLLFKRLGFSSSAHQGCLYFVKKTNKQ